MDNFVQMYELEISRLQILLYEIEAKERDIKNQKNLILQEISRYQEKIQKYNKK